MTTSSILICIATLFACAVGAVFSLVFAIMLLKDREFFGGTGFLLISIIIFMMLSVLICVLIEKGP